MFQWGSVSADDGERQSLLRGFKGNKKNARPVSFSLMSNGTFDLLKKQVNSKVRARSVRSLSDLEKEEARVRSRRTLYGALPFVAAFGMQSRESVLQHILSLVADDKAGSEIEEDLDQIIFTFPLLMSVLVSIVSQFLLGYNTSVMNAPASVVFPDHSTTEWSIAVSALAFGGPWGAMVGGWLANSFGRRGAMMINNVIFLLGGIIMTFAPSIWWLVPARLLIGFASGVSTVVVPVYLGEIAPPTLRGTLGTCTQFATTIGILLSGLVAFPWATPTRWRYIFAITPVLCIIQLFFSSYLLESPRWLLSNDTDSQHARKNIQKLRGFRSAKEVEDEVQHFIFASNLNKTDDKDDGAGHSALFSLLNSKDMRYLFFSALVLQAGQQLCGICAVFYYSTTFFEGVIDNPLMGTVLVGVVNVLATYLALKLMDNTGRKTLLLVSSGGMMISAMLIIAALKGYVYNIIAAVAVIAFVGFFEIGIGPIPWLIVAEMFDTKYVATAMSISSIVNWLGNFAVGLGFPFMSVYLGSWSFGPFIITLLIIFVFSHFFLIETLGKSVEEVNRLAMGEDDEDDSDNDQEANTAKNTSANTNLQPMEVSSKK